jgi:methionyl-tRNA formyltransferase
MKVVFCGTPWISAVLLEHIIKSEIKISDVICGADKPIGRKQILTPPPVKNVALKYLIPFWQPENKEKFYEVLAIIKPDLVVVVAYGMIFTKKILELAKIGFFNLHFSLLPKYRGPDPIRAQILNNESEGGATFFKIDEGIDSGPILDFKKITIEKDDTSTTFLNKLLEVSKPFLVSSIEKILSGNFILCPQVGEPSYTKKITVNDTFISFDKPLEFVYSRIRAFSYDPYSRFYFNRLGKKKIVHIISAKVLDKLLDDKNFECGSISGFEKGNGIFVKCLDGSIFIEKVKPEGSKEMNAYDYFINGFFMKIGDKI